MVFVDSHCHFSLMGGYGHQSLSFLQAARAVDVAYCLDICTSIDQFLPSTHFSSAHAGVFSALGVHPSSVVEEGARVLSPSFPLASYYDHPRVVAIGEVGLDNYSKAGSLSLQLDVFRRFCDLSLELSLPLVVHTRDAEEDTLSILRSYNGRLRGVIHCFTGSMDFGKACLDLGFYISFSGIITFKNALLLQEFTKIVPLTRLLLETDAPYLAPVPRRGQPNQPAYLTHTALFLSTMLAIPLERLGAQTTDNFFTLFSKASR